MKRADRVKTFQLFVFMLLAVICIMAVIVKGANSRVTGMLLWITLAVSFFFIFIDFTIYARQQKDYNLMMDAMRSDPVAKIANRYSVDALIDKYAEQALPKGFCCIAFEITNIKEINNEYGRKTGNDILRHFSVIMKMAALDKYFVGRNGGSRFIAMSEDAGSTATRLFLGRISDKIDEFNEAPANPTVKYKVGTAYLADEPGSDIVGLIALANRRIGSFAPVQVTDIAEQPAVEESIADSPSHAPTSPAPTLDYGDRIDALVADHENAHENTNETKDGVDGE